MIHFILNLSLLILSAEKPVIRLDEVIIEGNLRRPNLIEIQGSKLDEKVQRTALQNLIRLEEKLLKPSSFKKPK
ncbi:MAG: hypothetical protein J0L93_11275 [Deltaproteobacteria bacterium]|nr:hypothetical protein [Deltaproteobacteria bacterium]